MHSYPLNLVEQAPPRPTVSSASTQKLLAVRSWRSFAQDTKLRATGQGRRTNIRKCSLRAGTAHPAEIDRTLHNCWHRKDMRSGTSANLSLSIYLSMIYLYHVYADTIHSNVVDVAVGPRALHSSGFGKEPKQRKALAGIRALNTLDHLTADAYYEL